MRQLLDGHHRDPVLIMYRATGEVVIRELGDADTFDGIVLATPEELEDPRPRNHDAAWYTARACEINEHIETSGYIPAVSA